MLDAGVPLKTSVAGVAMGLILGEQPGDEPVILTDILGLEDALGTMDFKVAGDENGITAFQLDIKCDGLTLDTLKRALDQAKDGRLHILNKMKEVLSAPNELKSTIPRLMAFSVPPDLLGKVIGPKGKTIQTIIETYGVVNINVDDHGMIQVESFSDEKNNAVRDAVSKSSFSSLLPFIDSNHFFFTNLNIMDTVKIISEASEVSGGRRGKDDKGKVKPDGPPEIGTIYRSCPIVGVHAFGVFVEILPGYDGLVHLSELDTVKVS
jgi:polyribonucleotide nucleotidyltransferase